jgi:hypothetical protein
MDENEVRCTTGTLTGSILALIYAFRVLLPEGGIESIQPLFQVQNSTGEAAILRYTFGWR